MNLINPIYSFVEFRPGSSPVFLVTEFGDFILTEDGEFIITEDSYVTLEDTEACDYPLPIVLENDLKFQTFMQTAGILETLAFLAKDQKLFVVKPNAAITDDASLAANTLLAMPDNFLLTPIADNKVLLCWPFGLSGIDTFSEGQCFRLLLRAQTDSETKFFISNCFAKISDTKYTSVLNYSSDENNYGFDYCNGCNSNRVRLHLYVGTPQIKEEQSVYIRSTGKRKLLKYAASKLFDLVTEFFTYRLHEKITVALAHDVVYLTSAAYVGGIRKDGEYNIGWDHINDVKAPATTKVFAESYGVKNNNCDDCPEYTLPVTCAEIADIVATLELDCIALSLGYVPFVLPDGTAGAPYSYSTPFTGTGPVTLNDIVKPAWMNIDIDGSNIVFSGTPDAEASDVEVSFTLSNECSTLDFEDTIDVLPSPSEDGTFNWLLVGPAPRPMHLVVTIDGVTALDNVEPADGVYSGSLSLPVGSLVEVSVGTEPGDNLDIEYTGSYSASYSSVQTHTDSFTVVSGGIYNFSATFLD